MMGIYALAGKSVRTPGAYSRVDPTTGRPTHKSLRNTNEYIHPSVRSRFELDGPGVEDRGLYDCHALQDYKLRLTGGRPEENRPMAVWESRTKKKGAPKKVLQESPLWNTEIRLLQNSPKVYDFIYQPPKHRHNR